MEKLVCIIIPAYEPGDDFVNICRTLGKRISAPIIVVNDGSSKEYDHIFNSIKKDGNVVLKHAVNCGKGRGLKTAFNYVLNEYPQAIGVITADSDGQHKVEDIEKFIIELVNNPNELILGSRDFNLDIVPWKSKFGNKLTRIICSFLCGVNVSDTQTGLRGIPKAFMEHLMNTPGERFEFETNMLIDTKDRINIREVTIETVYDSKEDHKTHFHPVMDSLRIYKVFGRIFTRYLISSVSSFVIDILLFSLFCGVLRNLMPMLYVSVATVLARIISSTYNFAVNYGIVFKSSKRKSVSAVKYFVLALVIMGLSAFFTTIGVSIFKPDSETIIKIIVDTILFFLSYKVQQKLVF